MTSRTRPIETASWAVELKQGRTADPAGLSLAYEITDVGVAGSFLVTPAHEGLPGFVHGGLLATALDETMAATGYVIDGVPRLTVMLTIRYRRPVPLGDDRLRIEAERLTPPEHSRLRVTGRLLLADGRVAADARGLFVRAELPP